MRVLLFLFLALSLRAEVPTSAENPAANRIRPVAVVLSPDWTARIPPAGAVNAPEFLTTVYPGQRIAIGLIAEGPDRAHAFDGAKLRVARAPREFAPIAVRPLKAEGADFALMVLEAAKLSQTQQSEIAAKSTLLTLAVFDPDWTVPAADAPTELTLTAEISGTTQPVTLEPIRLKVRPTNDWLAGPPPAAHAAAQQMNRYRPGVAPGELIAALGAVARENRLGIAAVSSYFAFAFKTNPDARAAAIAAYERADPDLQPALLRVLRLGGADLPVLFPSLSADALEPFEMLAPLEDPRKLPREQDPVDPQAVSKFGNTMDQCWAGWMTTGDQSYLRALVDLLADAGDFPALSAWQQAHTGAKGLNARVVRGLRYMIAGWSISSFQHTDPLVMDWLRYWQKDPTVPAIIRSEIAALPTNPAFKRK
jgi:hypothetical protein